jgi:hypothetical protein
VSAAGWPAGRLAAGFVVPVAPFTPAAPAAFIRQNGYDAQPPGAEWAAARASLLPVL